MASAELPYVPLVAEFNGSDTQTGGDSLTENLNIWYQVRIVVGAASASSSLSPRCASPPTTPGEVGRQNVDAPFARRYDRLAIWPGSWCRPRWCY